MLLAEDLLLLVTDDASGRLSAPAAQVDAGLGGANLVELTLLNKVDLSGEEDQGKPGRIIVRDPSPAGDEVLDAALGILITSQGSKPSTVIRPLSKNLRSALYQRLAGSGMIRAGRGRTLGIFPARTWPAHYARHEEQVRQLVTQALVQQRAPDARTAALIALLHALKCEHKIIDPRPYQLSRRQLRARAEEIAKDNWASEAVRTVIAEMAAATATAAAAAASAGSPHEHTGPPAARTAPHGGAPAGQRRRGHRDTTRNALARHAVIARPCGRHPDIGLPNVQEPSGATAAP